METVKEMIADGCGAYLDGSPVDMDKIIVENFNIYIKDDTIILSK